MKTASLGRRLGDWLGIVPEDEIPWSPPADLFDIDAISHEVRAEPKAQSRPKAPPTPPVQQIRVQETRVPKHSPVAAAPQPSPESPAPSPVRLSSPIPEPAKNVMTFRQVVNQRRADAQRRAADPHTPARW
jgi:hypothetical protein